MGVRGGQSGNLRSPATCLSVVWASASNLCNSCRADSGGPGCSMDRVGGLMWSMCSMLRAREGATYRWSHKVVSADSGPRNHWGRARSMMTYCVDIPWHPLEARMSCGATGMCVREILIFWRVASSANSRSTKYEEAVMDFTANTPGGRPLAKSVPGNWSVVRGP